MRDDAVLHDLKLHHPSSSVATVLLYFGPLLCSCNVAIKVLKVSLWDACSWWSSIFQTDAITDAQPTDHGTEDINEENTAGYFLYGPVDYSSDARNCSAVPCWWHCHCNPVAVLYYFETVHFVEGLDFCRLKFCRCYVRVLSAPLKGVNNPYF